MGNLKLKDVNMRILMRDLLLNLWVVAAVLIGVKLCVWSYLTLTFVPTYTSSVTLAVSTRTASNAYSDLNTAESMAGIMSQILDSDLLLDDVRADLGEDAGSISFDAECIENTNFLVLSVTADSALNAYKGVESVLDHYDEVASEIVSNVVFQVVQQPTASFTSVTDPDADSPSTKAAIGCALAAAIIILLASYRRPTIKLKEQIKTDLNTNVIGTLPHEVLNKGLIHKMRKTNKGLLITNATSSFWFVENILNLRTKIEYQCKKKDCKAFLITSLMENEGKSTVAVNLALALGQKKNRVLLVDADMRKPAVFKLLSIDTKVDNPLADLLNKIKSDSPSINFYKEYGIWICAGSHSVRHSADLLGNGRLPKYIDFWKTKFDFIILDAPPMGVGADSEALADTVDATMLVVREDCAYIDPLNDAIDALSQTHSKFLGCILNDVHSSGSPLVWTYENHHTTQATAKSKRAPKAVRKERS